jgi:two-component system, OmpR family, sensor kinase
VAWATDWTSEGWSLERRLRNRLLAAMTGLWLLGSGLALYAQWKETNRVLDTAQEEIATTLLLLPTPPSTDSTIVLPHPAISHNQAMLMQVYAKDGRLVWRTQQAPDKPLAPLAKHLSISEGDWHIVVLPAPHLDRIAVVAAPMHDRLEALLSGAQALLLPLLALLPLTALTLTWMLRRVFRRLDDLNQDLRARDRGELDPVAVTGLPRELTPLAEGLNQLFERLMQVRQAERAFAANSAHELRTPIAAAQAQLQRLVHEFTHSVTMQGDERTAMLQRIDTLGRQLTRLHHLCVKLLQLSRADAGVGQHTEPVDLIDVAQLVLEEFNQPEQQARLHLELPTAASDEQTGDTIANESVMVQGDLDALGIALRNLIENALLHSGETQQVTVRITPLPSIEVLDEGPGIPPDRLDTVRQPFERGESPSPGHGLGLAIVSAIARQMGGTLDLVSPAANGHGLHAKLLLRPA